MNSVHKFEVSKHVIEYLARSVEFAAALIIASKGVWAIFILLMIFDLSVLGMWPRHRKAW